MWKHLHAWGGHTLCWASSQPVIDCYTGWPSGVSKHLLQILMARQLHWCEEQPAVWQHHQCCHKRLDGIHCLDHSQTVCVSPSPAGLLTSRTIHSLFKTNLRADFNFSCPSSLKKCLTNLSFPSLRIPFGYLTCWWMYLPSVSSWLMLPSLYKSKQFSRHWMWSFVLECANRRCSRSDSRVMAAKRATDTKTMDSPHVPKRQESSLTKASPFQLEPWRDFSSISRTHHRYGGF